MTPAPSTRPPVVDDLRDLSTRQVRPIAAQGARGEREDGAVGAGHARHPAVTVQGARAPVAQPHSVLQALLWRQHSGYKHSMYLL